MSKFYYSGSLEQVNYLSRHDSFLRSVYGKWQTMFAEGALMIILAIEIVTVRVFFSGLLKTYPNLLAYSFSAFFGIMALLFLISYLLVRENVQGGNLKFRCGAAAFACIITLLFPWMLQSLFGFITLIAGLVLLARKGKVAYSYWATAYKIFAWAVIIIGLGFIFRPSFLLPYMDYFEAALLFMAGIYLVKNSWSFRRTITLFEDEQEGFTDYKIE